MSRPSTPRCMSWSWRAESVKRLTCSSRACRPSSALSSIACSAMFRSQTKPTARRANDCGAVSAPFAGNVRFAPGVTSSRDARRVDAERVMLAPLFNRPHFQKRIRSRPAPTRRLEPFPPRNATNWRPCEHRCPTKIVTSWSFASSAGLPGRKSRALFSRSTSPIQRRFLERPRDYASASSPFGAGSRRPRPITVRKALRRRNHDRAISWHALTTWQVPGRSR